MLSAVVISYKNGNLIYETLDSIFCQDYPNIELIVSDDASDDDTFNLEQVLAYCREHAGENIKKILVRVNETHIGTVKHVETLRSLETGDIELLIAADDAWADGRVFSDFVDCFEKANWTQSIVVGQLGMYDTELKEKKADFISAEVGAYIAENNGESLLAHLADGCVLPGCSIAVRREVFDRLGALGTVYTLVEDYPFHIRALKNKETYGYLDRECAKHRDGGISHGNTRMASRKQQIYLRDIITILQLEFLEDDRISENIWAIANTHFLRATKHYLHVATYVPPKIEVSQTEGASIIKKGVPTNPAYMLKDFCWVLLNTFIQLCRAAVPVFRESGNFLARIFKYRQRV